VSFLDHPFHGPIHHLGYVVEDLEATAQRLVSELGAGPFFVLRDVSFEQVTSRGEAATFDHDSAFGQCGAVPIEVMQLKRLEPERVREGFSQSPPQLHHTAYVVPAGASRRGARGSRAARAARVPARDLGRPRPHVSQVSAHDRPQRRAPRRQPGASRLLRDDPRRQRGVGRQRPAAIAVLTAARRREDGAAEACRRRSGRARWNARARKALSFAAADCMLRSGSPTIGYLRRSSGPRRHPRRASSVARETRGSSPGARRPGS
jgi:Glyoxalase/Bleomycin resistance protein/Dioxygenase superfamily